MTDTIAGRVLSVSPVPLGDVLAEDAAPGDTVLTVRDAGDFDPDGGTLQLLSPDDATGTGVLVAYATVSDDDLDGDPDDEDAGAEPDEDDDAFDTITLTTPLAAAFPTDTAVLVWDPEFDVVATDYEAQVDVYDDEPLEADIAHALVDKLGPGARGLVGESVTIELVDDGAVIVGVHGKQPTTDGSYMAPDTVPVPVVELPEVSPTPTVEPGPASVVVSWPTPGPGLAVDVHVTLADDGPGAPVDGTTLKTAGAGQPCFVYTLPSGDPLPADADVQVALRVRNAAGQTAPPSAWVPGRSGQIPAENMLQLFGTVIAQRLVGETLEGTNIRAAILDIFDALYVGPDGATFKGSAELLDAVFRGNVTWSGLINWLLGTLTLAAGTPDPTTPPTVSAAWNHVATEIADDGADYADTFRGLCQRIGASGDWATVHVAGYVGTGVRTINKTTGDWWPFYDLSSWSSGFYAEGGITELGGSYYVLGKDGERNWEWWVYRLDADFAKTGEWKFANPTALDDAFTPAIGNDGTNLLIAYSLRDARTAVQKRTTGGAQVGSAVVLAGMGRSNFSGVGADPDSGTWWVARRTSTTYGYTTAGARLTARDVARANSTQVLGMVHDGTVLHHLDTVGRIWDYTIHPGGTFDYAWSKYDGDPGGLGLAESKPSERRSTAVVPRGARPVIGIPAIDAPANNDSPDRGIVYAATSGGTLRQQAIYSPGPPAETSRSFGGLVTGSGATPKTVSDFATRPGSALGIWRSEAIASDEQPLSFSDGHGNGRAVKQHQAGRVDLTAAATGTTYTQAVTFLEPFEEVPAVTVRAQNVTTLGSVEIEATAVTTDGFTIRYSRSAGGDFKAAWTADAVTQ